MSHHQDPLGSAIATANAWLSTVAQSLDTDDRNYTYRMVRAWFHTVRDRLSVISAAHLSAQMPEILRGMFFDGWRPAHVPVSHDKEVYFDDFAQAAMIDRAEVPVITGRVTDALEILFSPGQLDHAFATLPTTLVRTIWGQIPEDLLAADTWAE